MRIDAESCCGSEKEGLALFPVFTGLEEGLADLVDIRLCQESCITQGDELPPNGLCLVCKITVDIIDDIGDILLHDGLEGSLLL